MKHTRRRHLQFIASATIAPALLRVSCAQSWPARLIRVIIPFTAGSTIDIVARIVFEPLGRQLGQALVIENRGGGGGTVGAAAVARAEPDGYTLMAHSSAHVTTPAIYPNAPYDTAKDFAAVAAFGSSPNVTVDGAGEGYQDAAAARCCRQSQARLDHIRHCRRRLGDPHLRRDIALRRRL